MIKKIVYIFLGVIALIALFIISVFIVRALMGSDESSFSRKTGVGLVEVKGMILDSEETIRQLRYFDKQDSVKVVVLRVDSPGGVVAPSQEIYSEVKKFAAKKKIIVSMGSLAASGGYYISAPATSIYANPGTITASIGVLLSFSNIESLMDKIGIKSYTLKSGEYKDAGSASREMSKEDRAMFQSVIDNTHEQFVRAVAEGRKLPLEDVREIADGRILSGEQAKTLKLVDKLGSLQDAIDEAGRLSGISGEPEIITAPKKKIGILDILTGGIDGMFRGRIDAINSGPRLMYKSE